MKETDRILRETVRAVNKSHAQIGGLHNSFGELAEHLVAPGIIERFGELGYRFDGMASQYKIPGKREGSISAEVDLLLENADTVIAVEIKARPSHDRTHDDIAHHVRRLEKLRKHRERQGEPAKRILGAIAGAIFCDGAKEATLAAGFFAIEQSGDTMKIEVPEGFAPREW